MKYIFFIIIIGFFCLNFISAEMFGYNYLESGKNLNPSTITFNNNTGNVNNSQYLQGYSPTTLRDLFKTYYDTLYSDIIWGYNQSLATFQMWNASWDNRDLIKKINSSQWVVSGNNISNRNLGNVGIGTTNPLNRLQVYDSENVQGLFNGYSSNTGGGASEYSGEIILGRVPLYQGKISYDGNVEGDLFITNTWNNEYGDINILVRNNSRGLILKGNGDLNLTNGDLYVTQSVFQTILEGDNIVLKNSYTGGGWARAMMSFRNASDDIYTLIGAKGAGQRFDYLFMGSAYNNFTLAHDNSHVTIGNLDPTTAKARLHVLGNSYFQGEINSTGDIFGEDDLFVVDDGVFGGDMEAKRAFIDGSDGTADTLILRAKSGVTTESFIDFQNELGESKGKIWFTSGNFSAISGINNYYTANNNMIMGGSYGIGMSKQYSLYWTGTGTATGTKDNVIKREDVGVLVLSNGSGAGSQPSTLKLGNVWANQSHLNNYFAGNVSTDSYFIGDGSQLTGISSMNYTNLALINQSNNFTGNITAESFKPTSNAGFILNALREFWLFKFEESVAPNTGLRASAGGVFQYLYLNNSAFDVDVVNSVTKAFGIFNVTGNTYLQNTNVSGRLEVDNGDLIALEDFGVQGSSVLLGNTFVGSEVLGGANLSVAGNVNIVGNLNQTNGNASYNSYYGEMYYHNQSGEELSFSVQNTFYPVWFDKYDFINGFSYAGGYKESSNLTSEISGLYKVSYRLVGSGDNNHVYVTTVIVNGVDYNSGKCYDYKKLSAGGDQVPMGTSCFVRLDMGDTISVAVKDTTGTSTGDYYLGSINLVRIGD